MAEPIEAQERPPEIPEEHRAPRVSERDLRWKQRTRSPRFRMFLIIAVVVALVAGFFLWRYFTSYESTDDAQIDGHLHPVSARVGGHVLKLLITDNQYVQIGQPLLQVDPKDYQVLVERAQAEYDNAVAAARAAGVDVPITSTNTGSQLQSAEAVLTSARAALAAAQHQYDAATALVAQVKIRHG